MQTSLCCARSPSAAFPVTPADIAYMLKTLRLIMNKSRPHFKSAAKSVFRIPDGGGQLGFDLLSVQV